MKCRDIGPRSSHHIDCRVHLGHERIDFIVHQFQPPFEPADTLKGKIGNFVQALVAHLQSFLPQANPGEAQPLTLARRPACERLAVARRPEPVYKHGTYENGRGWTHLA